MSWFPNALERIPLSEREVRAARSVDAHQIRDAFRLVDAVGPLDACVVDPALAIELRGWRRPSTCAEVIGRQYPSLSVVFTDLSDGILAGQRPPRYTESHAGEWSS